MKAEVVPGRSNFPMESWGALFVERDRRYEERFRSSEEAVKSALAAQEKYSNGMYEAAKEAVAKAEAAQRAVNERQNEFRGQLSDQAATLMPRKEYEAGMASTRELLDREVKTLRADISSLREYRSEQGGKTQGISMAWAVLIGLVGLIGSLIAIYLRKP
jgi:acyl-CoA reductase-like NAD-dependent aldehyde dehydrogenase